ncbi:MAG: iron uptake porin [Symploca sp. SIO2B6]|nr:iron uptake porin [Symploca sp. SIO2B6]
MSKSWLINRALLTVTLLVSGSTIIAQNATANTITAPNKSITRGNSIIEQINRYSREGRGRSLKQITNTSQLRDVSPGEWAFEALRSLVERYGCIAGFPDGSFRGNQPLTRYEFAAGLNACLNQIEVLITSTEDFHSDLNTLQRLVQEFETELATLGTRVDNLEGRVAFLEDNQFSATTKLKGEVIFGLASVFAGEQDGDQDIDRVPVFGSRTRLVLNTSFSGEDLLFTRLGAGNFPEFSEETGTFEGRSSFSQSDDNDLDLEVLSYHFPLGDRTEVSVIATGAIVLSFADSVNILDGNGGRASISAFGTRNPIYSPVNGAGLGFTTELSEWLELSGGYLVNNNTVNNPADGNGLFNGPFSALGQLVFKPSARLKIGLTYVHSFNRNDTGTGTTLANFQSSLEEFADTDTDITGQTVSDVLDGFGLNTDIPVISNSYGLELSWQISDHFVLGGWGGYTFTDTLSTGNGLIDRGTIEILNFALTLGFPDLGKEGNLGGIVIGVEPYVVNSSIDSVNPLAVAALAVAGVDQDDLPIGEDDDISFHVEVFYQHQLTDNIAITPGVIWISAPNNNDDNEDLVIGTIRTTFSF